MKDDFIEQLGDDVALLSNAMAEKYPLGCDFGRYSDVIGRLLKNSEILHAIATDPNLKVVKMDELMPCLEDFSARVEVKAHATKIYDLIGGDDE